LLSLALFLPAACSGNMGNESAAKPALNSPASIAMHLVADRTGGNADEVEVLSVEAVDFSDSSLGCPQPGKAYLQVITPGHRVLTEYAGQSYDVRIAAERALICDPRASKGTKR